MTIKRSNNWEILHEVVEYNGVLHLAGVVSEDTSLDMAGQARDVFRQIDALLAAHGSHRDKLLTALLFITDMSQKPAMNEEWKKWLSKEHMPTRATLGVADLGPGVLLEVVTTAAK